VINTNITLFEESIGFSLPHIYRQFLIEKNGGTCRSETLKTSVGVDVLANVLFSLNHSKSALDLETWYEECLEDLPERSLVIGADSGSGLFVLCEINDKWKVYYYDYSYTFPSSDDNENTYEIDKSLSELLALCDDWKAN